MESCYTLALKELERIKAENKKTEDGRKREVSKKIPEIAAIEEELIKSGTALLKCVLNKGKNFEQIKENIKSLQKRKQSLLEKNGYPKDYLEEIITCKNCGDTGFTEDGKRCSCHKALILKYMGINSNLTENMLKQNFENFDISLFKNQSEKAPGDVLKVMSKLLEKAMKFAEEFDKTGENLLICGNAGTGKTYLASCIANRALERGKSVYYQSAFKLFEMFENAKFKNGENEDNSFALNFIYDTELLIIDDIGTEFITQYTSAVFFDILSSRINSKKSTIITTNLELSDIDRTYSTRVASRLIGDYTVLLTIGGDIRHIKKNR